MRNIVYGLLVSLALVGSASAQSFFAPIEDLPAYEGNVSLASNFVHKGFNFGGDEASLGLDFQVNNVVLPGLSFKSKFDTYRLQPISDSTQVRTDLGIAYGFTLNEVFEVELAVHRVHNPQFDALSYNEPRVRLGYKGFYTEAHYNEKNGNYYYAGGVDYPLDFWVDGLTVGAVVSAIDYGVNDEFKFNNAQVYARYNVWNNVDLIGAYSYADEDAFGNDRSNEAWVQVELAF